MGPAVDSDAYEALCLPIRSGKLPADRIYCVNHILSTRVSLQSPNAQKDKDTAG